MLKAVLIDDERPALRGLEVMLKKHDNIEIAGLYSDPLEGIERVGGIKPDVVFLDINMPQLSGLDAVSAILNNSPDTNIVFVTAYDEYAVKAFELDALDYLLKPVDFARLTVTINRMQKKKSESTAVEKNEANLIIRCFGLFDVYFEGRAPIRWRAEKTKELFAFFLHNAQREISKDEILDALWQNDNPEKAVRQLYNGIYYIRKAMAEYGIDRKLLSIDRFYNLRLGDVDFDISCFNKLYKQKDNRIEALTQMETMYTGDYFGTLPYDWAIIERNRLLDTYISCVYELAKIYIEQTRYDEAEAILKKAYKHDPLSENVTSSLLTVYKNTCNKPAAIKHYKSYSSLLDKELNIKPSESVRNLLEW